MDRLTTRNQYTGKAILRDLPAYGEYDPIEKLCLYEEAEDESESNDPLTIEELQDMDGQPVWIKFLQGGFETGAVIDKLFDRVVAIWAAGSTGIEKENTYGETWIAYRYPLNDQDR